MNWIRARLLVLDSLVMMRQVMEIVLIRMHKKLSNDAHWMCSDICILTGSTEPPGVALSAGCVGRNNIAVRYSVEGISLYSEELDIAE